MNSISRKLTFLVVSILCSISAADSVIAQDLFMKYEYRFDLSDATEAPKFNEFPRVEFPDSARKNGVEGTCNVCFMLGDDEAVKNAVEKIRFEPAIHKKSKKKVTQKVMVEVKFKP